MVLERVPVDVKATVLLLVIIFKSAIVNTPLKLRVKLDVLSVRPLPLLIVKSANEPVDEVSEFLKVPLPLIA